MTNTASTHIHEGAAVKIASRSMYTRNTRQGRNVHRISSHHRRSKIFRTQEIRHVRRRTRGRLSQNISEAHSRIARRTHTCQIRNPRHSRHRAGGSVSSLARAMSGLCICPRLARHSRTCVNWQGSERSSAMLSFDQWRWERFSCTYCADCLRMVLAPSTRPPRSNDYDVLRPSPPNLRISSCPPWSERRLSPVQMASWYT